MTNTLIERQTLLGFIHDLESIIGYTRSHYADDQLNLKVQKLSSSIRDVIPPETVADIEEYRAQDLETLPGCVAAHVANPNEYEYVILDRNKSEWMVYNRVVCEISIVSSKDLIPGLVRCWGADGELTHIADSEQSRQVADAGQRIIDQSEFLELTANAIFEARGKQGRVVGLCTRKGRFLLSEYEGTLTADEAWDALLEVAPSAVYLVRG